VALGAVVLGVVVLGAVVLGAVARGAVVFGAAARGLRGPRGLGSATGSTASMARDGAGTLLGAAGAGTGRTAGTKPGGRAKFRSVGRGEVIRPLCAARDEWDRSDY
jgi:hypothetical protein